MKTMKVALLASAALAVVSVSARADDVAALKAQLEALNARVAQLEAAPAVPVGYSLLTINEADATVVPGLEVLHKDAVADGKKATVIGIMPTADMPATTSIEWSGHVRAAIVLYHYDDQAKDQTNNTGVQTRMQLKVVGKTDTAVGEVGAKIQMRATTGLGDYSLDVKPGVVVNEAWGWWAMTPEVTLGGGYSGSLGNIGYGYDGACTCYITDSSEAGNLNPGDASQLRLSWASGPISMAVAVEDASYDSGYPNGKKFGGTDASLGAAAEIKYTGDAVNGEVSAVWHDGGESSDGLDNSYQVGAGLGFALGDMATLSLSAATGQVDSGQNFWGFGALVSANLSDSVHAEVAYAMKHYSSYNGTSNGANQHDNTGILAGIYYDPVSQLTIGLEGEIQNPSGGNNNVDTVDLVTVFRF